MMQNQVTFKHIYNLTNSNIGFNGSISKSNMGYFTLFLTLFRNNGNQSEEEIIKEDYKSFSEALAFLYNYYSPNERDSKFILDWIVPTFIGTEIQQDLKAEIEKFELRFLSEPVKDFWINYN